MLSKLRVWFLQRHNHSSDKHSVGFNQKRCHGRGQRQTSSLPPSLSVCPPLFVRLSAGVCVSHLCVSLCASLCVPLSVCLSLCVSLCVLSVSLSASLSLRLPLCVSLPLCLSLSLCLCVSLCVFLASPRQG